MEKRSYKKRWISFLLVMTLCFGFITPAGEVEAARLTPLNPVSLGTDNSRWDCVWFGNYMQNKNSTEKTPIKWRVLSVNTSDMLLMADRALDAHAYHSTNSYVTFANSALCGWLNSQFAGDAFTAEELASMVTMDGTSGKKVALLTKEEAGNTNYGFKANYNSNSRTRVCRPTEYAKARGVIVYGDYDPETEGNCDWLLMGSQEKGADSVAGSGLVPDLTYGSPYDVNFTDASYGIRPVIRVKLTDMNWSPAGTVTAQGEVAEISPQKPETVDVLVGDQNQYVTEHVRFVNSAYYRSMLDKRMASYISAGMNTTDKKSAALFYNILKSVSDISQCKSLSVFSNPFDAVILDLLLEQGRKEQVSFNVSLQSEQVKAASKVYETIEKACRDEYAMGQGTWTPTSEYKTYIEKIFMDPSKDPEEVNPEFYRRIKPLLEDYFDNEQNAKDFMNAFGKAGTMMKAVSTYSNVVDWVTDCANYSSAVNAYLSSSQEFKELLLQIQYYSQSERSLSSGLYAGALDQYIIFQSESLSEEDIARMMYDKFFQYGSGRVQDVFGPTVAEHATAFVTQGLGLTQATAGWVFAVIKAYNAGITISDYLTGNDKIMDYRVHMNAWNWLEDYAASRTRSCAASLQSNPTYKKAKEFDAAYTLMQICQTEMLNTYQKYLNYYIYDKEYSDQSTFQGFLIKIFQNGRYKDVITDKELALKLMSEWKNASCHDPGRFDTSGSGLSYHGESMSTGVTAVCCPTDVYVYDKNGKVVLQIEDDEIRYQAPFVCASVYDHEKRFALPDRENYTIQVKATDNGSMDYREMVFTDSDRKLVSTEYKAVAIRKGDIYTATSEWDGRNQKLKKGETILSPTAVNIYTDSAAVPKSSAPAPKKPVLVSSIRLSGISHKIAAGRKITLKAKVLPKNAANKKVKWTVSNKKVASVTQKGVVKIKKRTGGKSVYVRATALDGSRKYARYKITSMKGIVKKIKVTGKKKVKAGKKIKLKAKVTSTRKAKANRKLIWKSSKPKYATVTSTGRVTAKKAGRGKKVTITAYATDGSGRKGKITIRITK